MNLFFFCNTELVQMIYAFSLFIIVMNKVATVLSKHRNICIWSSASKIAVTNTHNFNSSKCSYGNPQSAMTTDNGNPEGEEMMVMRVLLLHCTPGKRHTYLIC